MILIILVLVVENLRISTLCLLSLICGKRTCRLVMVLGKRSTRELVIKLGGIKLGKRFCRPSLVVAPAFIIVTPRVSSDCRLRFSLSS